MKPISMARHILLLLALLTAGCPDASAVKPDVFSSPSTVRRVIEVEKSKDFKDFKKQIKKRYDNIKDVAVEEWTDGVTYYVLYCKNIHNNNDEFGLMRLTDSIPLFDSKLGFNSSPHLEFTSIYGYPFFKVTDSSYLFYNGEWQHFNPKTDIKTFGDRQYIVIPDATYTRIFSLDGTQLLFDESFEFRDATPAGFTYDEATGMSIYHPALPPRFFGQTKTEHLRQYGQPITYRLGFFRSPNSSFEIQVPGGEYYVSRYADLIRDVKTEIRTDPNGNMHEYKVFEVGEGERFKAVQTTLCRHGGTTGEPILSGKFSQIRISTPDQIVYYDVYDSENFMSRTGCISLVDTTFKVVPRFADVKVFYDNEKKPYALVRMSSIGQYELYDPSKSYDYSAMSQTETAFEKQNWHKVIKLIKPEKIEDFQEKDLMIWFQAETKQLEAWITLKEDELKRFNTGTLFDVEREELEKEAAGTDNYIIPRYSSYRSYSSYNLEDAFEYFAGKYQSDKAENYLTLAKYVKELVNRDEQLYAEIVKAKDDYIDGIKETRRQMELAQQRQVYEAMEARQINEARQQQIMLQVLGVITGVVNQIVTPSSPAPAQQTSTGAPQTVSPYGPSMLDQTSISPEIMGMAVSSGWVPESPAPSSESTSSSTSPASHSSSSRICHSCYGSGKCPHCHGKGYYAPNMDGHMIECTACKKTGVCHSCNGTGHH